MTDIPVQLYYDEFVPDDRDADDVACQHPAFNIDRRNGLVYCLVCRVVVAKVGTFINNNVYVVED